MVTDLSTTSLKEGNRFKGEDEVTIRVGRNGELLFEDGQHVWPWQNC